MVGADEEEGPPVAVHPTKVPERNILVRWSVLILRMGWQSDDAEILPKGRPRDVGERWIAHMALGDGLFPGFWHYPQR